VEENKPIVVVGSGPSGLMQALYLACTRKKKVVVVESKSTIGGLFNSIQTPWGLVDLGVHVLQETGYKDWDDLLEQVLPSNDWHILEGVHKDIAGNIFVDQLDKGSLYPDLRRLPREDYIRCMGEMFSNLHSKHTSLEDSPNLAIYLENRFGDHAMQCVYNPLSRKIWRQPLDKLSPWAAKIVHLNRVVVHDAATSLALKASPLLDDLIGFPAQLDFPDIMRSNRRKSFYPRKYGLKHVVDGLKQALFNHGVKIMTSTKIKKLEFNSEILVSALLGDANNNEILVNLDALVWTAPQFELLPYLGISCSQLPDKPIPHRVVYLFLDRPPLTGELYWLWCYDSGSQVVRVSNPTAFCPDASRMGYFPVCVEMHVDNANISDAESIAQSEKDLRRYKLIEDHTIIAGGIVLPSINSFFIPTLANCNQISQQHRSIDNARITNIILSTQNINRGIFYLSDILNASQAELDKL